MLVVISQIYRPDPTLKALNAATVRNEHYVHDHENITEFNVSDVEFDNADTDCLLFGCCHKLYIKHDNDLVHFLHRIS